jgi:diaminopimelate decarboxylase
MNEIVIEHVPVADLPQAWRDQLAQSAQTTDARVTVRIEAEHPAAAPADESFITDDPAFGIWRDREDMADVAAYIRRIRTLLHCLAPALASSLLSMR